MVLTETIRKRDRGRNDDYRIVINSPTLSSFPGLNEAPFMKLCPETLHCLYGGSLR